MTNENKFIVVIQHKVYALERLKRSLARRYFKATHKIDKEVIGYYHDFVEDIISDHCRYFGVKRKSAKVHFYTEYTTEELYNEIKNR